MKQKGFIAVFSILGLAIMSYFYSCRPSEDKQLLSQTASVTLRASAEVSLELSKNDTLAIIDNIKAFLIWYKNNYLKVNEFEFTSSDSTGNYVVNTKECEKYLQYLKSSELISEDYIQEWRKYFSSRKEYFIDNPQNEGPAEGFDMDLVLITQEPELILDAIDKLEFKAIEINSNNAVMQVNGEFMYNFEMSKKEGKWKIDYIATENYD